MKKTTDFYPLFLFKRATNITILAIISLLIILSGFRKDTRKPFRNYVVLVSLDAFRWDYSKLYNTPNLNKLAKDGLHLKRIINSKN